MGSNAIANREAARKTALPHAPGHEEWSSSPSCKFYVCSTIAVDHSQKPANEFWQFRHLKYMENPRVIDAGICGGKIRQ